MNTVPKQVMTINKAGVAPVAAGVNTDWDKAQLPLGAYSNAVNVRPHGPGFRLRPGMTRHHTTDIGSVLSMFSYKIGEKFYAQDSLGDVYEATDEPPVATTGAFGTKVIDESALNDDSTGTIIPGSWSNFRDHLLFSEGKIQHMVKPAISAKPLKVIFRKAPDFSERMIEGGIDITDDVTDTGSDKTTDVFTFTVADFDSLFICTEFPMTELIFDLDSLSTGTTLALGFYDGDNWQGQSTGITDGTSGLTQDGTFEATMAGRETDGGEYPTVKFGQSGYWYNVRLVGGGPTETISFNSITYNGDFRLIENVMDPVPGFIIEAQVEGSSGEYATYAASTVSLSELAIGDYLYIATDSPAWAFYFDVGSTPNSTSTSMNGFDVWDGTDWTAVTNKEDETNGLFNSGYVSMAVTGAVPEQRAFQHNKNYMYWYRVKWTAIIAIGTIVSISYLNYNDINELGRSGKVSTVWKDRGCYTFSKFDRDIYVSKKYRMSILNGSDYAILTPGDGRYNQVTAMLPFYNELMVFQSEEGTPGGCLTLFEGYSPETFGKLVLSTKLGTFSQQSVCIIDASTGTTRTTDVTQTLVCFISKYGIFVTDGRTIKKISGEINNYFDPEKAEYINITPGTGHWVSYDRANNCLRFGIETIASTTGSPDAYPVYHLDENYWTFDEFPYLSITSFCEVSAASGDVDSLQYCGTIDTVGSTDLIYRCVSGQDYDERPAGTKDAVQGELQLEFSNGANLLEIKELLLRSSSDENYLLTKTIYENGVADSGETETFSMESGDTGGLTYRERILEGLQLNHHFSINLSWKNVADPASWGAGPVLYDYISDISAGVGLG